MKRAELKRYLGSFKKEELIEQIMELSKRFKPVQEYYHMLVTDDQTTVIEKYKKQIENEFFPPRGLPKMRTAVARKAVSDGKKIRPSTCTFS
jgi:hypothetical protein